MVTFESTVVIDRPAHEVFAYLADLEHVPEWNYAIEGTRKLDPGPVAVGTRYVQRRALPRRGEETLRVTVLEPDRRLAIAGSLGPFDAELDYRLTGAAGQTRVINEVRLRPRGIAGLLGRAAAGRIRGAVGRNLTALKAILEGAPQR